MRHLTKSNKTFAVVAAVVGVAALLMATVAFASTPRTSTLPEGSAARYGKQVVLGTIDSFSPTSVLAGSGSLTLQMGVSPDVAAVPATWTAQWDGPSGLYAMSVVATSTTSVSVSVPSGATTSVGSVTVTLSDQTTAWSGGYYVTGSLPVIDSISPSIASAGGSDFVLTVSGSGFAIGTGAAYVRLDGAALTTPSGYTNTSTTLYATVPASALAIAGTRTITVFNPRLGGGDTSNSKTLTVSGPVVTGLSPTTGASTETALTLTLTGTNLDLASTTPGLALKGTGTNVATTITGTGVRYNAALPGGAPASITGSFNLANITGAATPVPAPAGTYSVVLTYYAATVLKTITLSQQFVVTGASLTAISPATATNGVTAQTMTLTGTGLSGLTTPVVTLKGPGTTGTTVVTATGVSSVAPGTTMTCTFNLTSPTVAPAGVYDVIITYATSKTLTKAQSFTVTNAAPVVTAVSPNLAWAGSVKPTTLTVTGSGFVPPTPLLGAVGSRVQIGTRVTSDTTLASASQLTVPLTAADIAVAGTVPITVVNPTPGGGTSTSVPLTVNADSTTPITTVSGADTSWHRRPVTLTVQALDAQSGVQVTQWTQNGGSPSTLSGSTITIPAPAGGAGDGVQTIKVWSTDWCNHVENPPISLTVKIDTVGPKTYASAPSPVKKGSEITFKYRADDVSPKCGVVLKIKTSHGTVKRTYDLGRKSSNKSYTYKVNPNLGKGSYKLFTYAKDMAGNQQSKLGTAAFKVK